jgi:Zn-finger nucleic acid-binding protein
MSGQPVPGTAHCPNCGANVSLDSVKCSYCQAVLARSACPSCFGAIFQGMKFCPNCGSHVNRANADAVRNLDCPRCGKALSPSRIGGTRIDECTNCGGIWLDQETFDQICRDAERQEIIPINPNQIEKRELEPVSQSARMYMPCPVCGNLMLRKNYAGCSGVIVDWCRPHGTWFDHQELQQIINFIKSGGLQDARKKETDKLHEEQERLRALQYGESLEQGADQDRSLFRGSVPANSLLSVIIIILRRIFGSG